MSAEEHVLEYLETLPFPPYPVQEEALLAWGEARQGVLLSAPTGTGKTLVAEGAIYDAVKSGKIAYYSTPLVALTDQKFLELQDTLERWGYPRERVGLVTGHRTVNPNAQVKVVVAEVLLNRLLHPAAFSFDDVSVVVMDEFHNFNEPQRGIVWELSLALLPRHVRVMLLSATVGSAQEFVGWMARALDRTVTLVEGRERKVPLHYTWVGDELLPDFMERIASGTEQARRTPALVFCFDRAVCWDVAEVLKGKDMFATAEQRQQLLDRLESFDFSVGSGNKLRTFLTRGVGIHHAGLLPRYRRVVEVLFQEKLLPVCICTETLAAGLNLPARSVVLTTLVKGPRDKKKLIEVASAQQIFGRAGRPRYDTEGYVYALAHEDDVKLAKWQEKYDSIPETEKDPKLLAARKAILKKKPTKRSGFTYWNADQFAKLQTAPPMKLASRGRLTWRWLGYLLEADVTTGGKGEIEPIRDVIRRRLMTGPEIEGELKRLTKMLVTLDSIGVVKLTPPPPPSWTVKAGGSAAGDEKPEEDDESSDAAPADTASLASRLTLGSGDFGRKTPEKKKGDANLKTTSAPAPLTDAYDPAVAAPTEKLKQLMIFRAVHPLYGLYLLDYLGIADDHETLQIMESLLEMPGTVARMLRVPRPDELPPGRLTTEVIDPAMLTKGLASQEDMYPPPISEQLDIPPELRRYPIPLAEKMKRVFESDIDHAGGLFVNPVWAIGDLLAHGGSFDNYIRSRDLLKQEGVVFKHALRMVLLCEEFSQLTPHGLAAETWKAKMDGWAETLSRLCREVDPQSTDEMLEEMAE